MAHRDYGAARLPPGRLAVSRARRADPAAGLAAHPPGETIAPSAGFYTAHVRILVLGLGNPLLGDDAIGLQVAAAVRERLAGRDDVEVRLEEAGGLRLMEVLAGFDRAVVVDAVVSGGTPGAIRRLRAGDVPTQRTAIAHGIDLPRALELGRALGEPMPQDVRVVAIEADSVLEFREWLTPAVEAALQPAVEAVLAEVGATA
jgi:hydrogenase maturation protease